MTRVYCPTCEKWNDPDWPHSCYDAKAVRDYEARTVRCEPCGGHGHHETAIGFMGLLCEQCLGKGRVAREPQPPDVANMPPTPYTAENA